MHPGKKMTGFIKNILTRDSADFEATLASMIESMDKSLGDIMIKVKQLGIENNTVIIFMSDNGAPSQCPQNYPFADIK